MPLSEVYTQCHPSHFTLHNNNIVYCNQSILHVNSHVELPQYTQKLPSDGIINHLITDDVGIALTTAGESVMISNLDKGIHEANLHHYGGEITALHWKNSLAITGDSQGLLNLWVLSN